MNKKQEVEEIKVQIRNRLDYIINRIIQNNSIVYMNIVGHSGSGKTNFALWFYERYVKPYEYELALINDYTDLSELMDYLNSIQNTYLIFDDTSFILNRHTTIVDEFLHTLVTIRHKINKAIFVFIHHYFTSILPLFRMSQIFVLTSIKTSQIRLLKHDFDLQTLWDYAHAYYNGILHNEYYALIDVLGIDYIVKIPLSTLYMNNNININPHTRIRLTEQQKQKLYEQLMKNDNENEKN